MCTHSHINNSFVSKANCLEISKRTNERLNVFRTKVFWTLLSQNQQNPLKSFINESDKTITIDAIVLGFYFSLKTILCTHAFLQHSVIRFLRKHTHTHTQTIENTFLKFELVAIFSNHYIFYFQLLFNFHCNLLRFELTHIRTNKQKEFYEYFTLVFQSCWDGGMGRKGGKEKIMKLILLL